MSVFNVPVVIGVDEEKIAKEVEKDAKNQVIKAIQEQIMEVMFEKPYWSSEHVSDEPLREMVKDEIRKFMVDKENIIIDKAAELLAYRLVRTKKVREKVDEVMDEVLS